MQILCSKSNIFAALSRLSPYDLSSKIPASGFPLHHPIIPGTMGHFIFP